MAQGEPGDHPENSGTGHIDHERPVREQTAEPARDAPIHEEAQDGADTAEEHDPDPDEQGHSRTRNRRVTAVAICTAA
jgi:hypothetical protein